MIMTSCCNNSNSTVFIHTTRNGQRECITAWQLVQNFNSKHVMHWVTVIWQIKLNITRNVGHVEDILLLNKCFFQLSIHGQRSCAMVPRWRFLATFLRPVFAASREQFISDLHSKFALGHAMCRSIMASPITQGGHNTFLVVNYCNINEATWSYQV